MSEGFIPQTVVIEPSNPPQLATVSVVVSLTGRPTKDQPVAIAVDVAGFFSSIPEEVTVRAGDNSVVFIAVVSSTATGTATVAASCNNGSAWGTCTVAG